MKITIKGKPIAKKRPRFARKGKFVTTYNDQHTEGGRILWEAQRQINEKPLSGPIELFIKFYMPIPKSTSKKLLRAMRNESYPHIKRPDLDNLLKMYKDILNGVAWDDDSQVYKVKARKIYSHEPRTEIVIKEVFPVLKKY